MRIVLVTGKGGVGKTTVAAATALQAADQGRRTLVMSTDPAHSLADAFRVPLGDAVSEVAPRLWGQQIDAQHRLEMYWGDIRKQLMAVFDWGGVTGIEAEEFLVFPGMDELFSLLEVTNHAESGEFDLLVVDCAPTAETFRLLSLPEVMSWYFDRVFSTERRVMKAARPVLTRVTNLPIPGDNVYEAVEGIFDGIEAAKKLLANTQITSARLVVNPEKMVIDEARRTYTYLGLFGYGVDAVVVNRVLPDEVTDPYFARWREVQAEHLDDIRNSFAEVPVIEVRLFDDEMVGIERLRALGRELYGDRDPAEDFFGITPFDVKQSDHDVLVEMRIPFAEAGEIDVFRHGGELYVTVGSYRRSFMLPDSLKRRRVMGASLSDGVLEIRFTGDVPAS
jgi:arsenite-transporting ATPase